MDSPIELNKLSDSEIISDGKYVLVQRGDQHKMIEFKLGGILKFGRGNSQQDIQLKNANGLPFHSTFRVHQNQKDIKGKQKSSYYLEPIQEQVNSVLSLAGDRSSFGKDNRNILDDRNSQPLGQTDIAALREKGVSGPEILDTLINSSKSFGQKTEFSQEKYIKKKERAYGDALTFSKPTLSLVADYYFKRDPTKILNLRADSLSQLLTYSNVYSGGKFMVYETACSGLLIAAVLQRLGGNGLCLHIHTGSTPQRQALQYMNFDVELKALQTLDIFYIIRPALNIQDSPDANDEGESIPKKAKLEIPENSEPIVETSLPPIAENEDLRIVKLRSVTRSENEKSASLLQSIEFDGLIICGKEHPLTILQNLLPRLAASAPFSVFCQYPEPLLECYTYVKDGNLGINLSLFDNWFRNIQVQQGRTHPEILMTSTSGYILTVVACIIFEDPMIPRVIRNCYQQLVSFN